MRQEDPKKQYEKSNQSNINNSQLYLAVFKANHFVAVTPSQVNIAEVSSGFHSFKSCGLNLNTNGSEDGLIHCFKEGEPCHNGREQLLSQLDVLAEPDRPNPFDLITDSRR